MSRFSERIEKRKQKNQSAFEDSFRSLAGLSEEEAIKTRDDFILNQISKFFDAKNKEVPEGIEGLSARVDYLLKHNGIIGRKIELTGTWYLDNRDPILVFTKEGHVPILLLPKGQSIYYFTSYVTGKRVIGTVMMAKKLETDAYAFYKPLPSHALTFKEYLRYFRRSVRAIDLIWVTIFSALAIGIGMLIPYLMKQVTGEVVTAGQEGDYGPFGVVSVYIISAGLAYILIKSTQAFMNARVGIKIEKMMQETTMMRLLSLPASFFKRYSTGELLSRYNAVATYSSLMFNGVFLTALSSIMSLVYLAQIIQFTSSLVLPVVLVLLLTTVFSAIVSFIQVKVTRKQTLLSAKESGTAYAMIAGIQKIRLAGAEKRAFARWAKDYAKSSEPLYHPPLIIRLGKVIPVVISLLGSIAIYYIAAKDRIDVSSFLAFASSYAALTIALTSLGTILTALSNAGPVLEMAKPILEEPLEDSGEKEIVDSLHGDIRFEDVCFQYNEADPMIVDHLNLHIHEGEYVGIVGKTGCGKSTLVRLLLGFEKPTTGHLYYDEKDIDTLNLQSLRSHIGSVTQNGGIFHADILSNILITAPTLGPEDAWEAAKIAGIDEDIKKMPMGIHTVISEGQGGISGGQKQRIMIARAIVNKPKILIFDEATSALDNKTQKSISESITQLNCTRIVIAHRLSTIKECDRILFMEDGKILESGTYEELIERQGKFAELVERQRIEGE